MFALHQLQTTVASARVSSLPYARKLLRFAWPAATRQSRINHSLRMWHVPLARVWPNDMKTTTPQNLTFADGPVGTAPRGWFAPTRAYSAVTVAADQCHGGQQCATVHFLRPDFSPGSFLMQNLDVTPYRGQILTYRAFVRVDPARKSVARLLVRIHRKDCTTSFRDDMGDHPIVSGDWAVYEIHAPIAMDAYHMEFGMQLFGQGAAWIDQISMKMGRRKLLSAPVRAAAQENSVPQHSQRTGPL